MTYMYDFTKTVETLQCAYPEKDVYNGTLTVPEIFKEDAIDALHALAPVFNLDHVTVQVVYDWYDPSGNEYDIAVAAVIEDSDTAWQIIDHAVENIENYYND